jgi:type IV pilus biogenesis protein CpaD/CtpE
MATLPVPLEEQTTTDNEQVLKAFAARLPRAKQLPCTMYVNASNNEASATQYAQTLATQIRAQGLQARIVRRAQSFNAAATVELIVAVEEK